jgi:hypothetical protein
MEPYGTITCVDRTIVFESGGKWLGRLKWLGGSGLELGYPYSLFCVGRFSGAMVIAIRASQPHIEKLKNVSFLNCPDDHCFSNILIYFNTFYTSI